MTVGATEVADFLKDNPDFLNHNPGILAFVTLPQSNHGNVTSLQERQVLTLRDKVRSLEQRIVEMTRAAVENHAIVQSLQLFQRNLLAIKNPVDLPHAVSQGITSQFKVPMVNLFIWGAADEFELPQRADPPNTAVLTQLDRLQGVYCGFAENSPYPEAFQDCEIRPRSVVVMPLRIGVGTPLFGCIALGSPDKDRFSPTLETDFLNSLNEAACAALSRLVRLSPPAG